MSWHGSSSVQRCCSMHGKLLYGDLAKLNVFFLSKDLCMSRVNGFFKGLAIFRVLRHPALLRLWLAQVIYLSVQFTASYAMIVLVTNETNSATLVGVLIITLSLP